MSDVRDPERDQAAPVPNDNPSCHDLVIEDIKERKAHGLRKYDSLLQAGNGRNFVLDIYEELLDATAYMRGLLEEQNSPGEIGVKTEPTEFGFYRYSGGSQSMLFTRTHGGWYVIHHNGVSQECDWGYIEQALGVYDLIKIEGDGS